MNRDGLVFLKFEYKNNAEDYINVSKIVSFKSLTQDQCKDLKHTFPATAVYFDNKEEPTVIGNLLASDFEKMIKVTIKNHYENLAENIITGND